MFASTACALALLLACVRVRVRAVRVTVMHAYKLFSHLSLSLPSLVATWLAGMDTLSPQGGRGRTPGGAAEGGGARLPRRPADPLIPEVKVDGQNEKQDECLAALRGESVHTVICFGHTGTGKTHVAVAAALQWLRVSSGQRCKIILLRPVDESMTRHPTQEDHDYYCSLNKPALELVRGIAFPKLSGHKACLEHGPPPIALPPRLAAGACTVGRQGVDSQAQGAHRRGED